MFSSIIGHQAQKAYLSRVIEQGTMAHAYCFSGPSGFGKMTIAQEFTGQPHGVAPTANVNLTMINGGSVEEIRDLRERLSLSAFGGTRKIAIIDQADQMTVAAQNALLKTLEEPQGQTTIILIASDSTRLLPTILSRTVHLRFTLVERELICQMLRRRGNPMWLPGESDALSHELAGFASGRPGVAMNFSRPETLVDYRKARDQAVRFIDQTLTARIRQIDELVKASREDKSQVENFLDQVMFVLHERLLDNAESTGQPHGVAPTAQALEALLESRDSLNHNGNRSIILEHMAINV